MVEKIKWIFCNKFFFKSLAVEQTVLNFKFIASVSSFSDNLNTFLVLLEFGVRYSNLYKSLYNIKNI